MYITFMFIILGNRYFGKYHTDNISPEHNGLDEEIRPYLLKGISEYNDKIERKPHILPEELSKKVKIGIISVSNDTYISIHSSNEEKLVFDFYCQKFTINHTIRLEMYMFGNLIENPDL